MQYYGVTRLKRPLIFPRNRPLDSFSTVFFFLSVSFDYLIASFIATMMIMSTQACCLMSNSI